MPEDTPTRLEMQHTAIDEAEGKIRERREHVAGDVYEGMVDAKSLDLYGDVGRYLRGYGDALAWAGDRVESIHRLKPDQKTFDFDPGRIEDDSVSQWMQTLLTEAIAGNLGNVYCNVPSLIDALDKAYDDGPPDAIIRRRAEQQARTLAAHTAISLDEIAEAIPDNPYREEPFTPESVEKWTQDIERGSGDLPISRADK